MRGEEKMEDEVREVEEGPEGIMEVADTTQIHGMWCGVRVWVCDMG